MEPAFHIPLDEDELRTLGEISAIQGQIELSITLTVQLLLDISHETALRILGSTSLGNNIDIWHRIVLEKAPEQRATADRVKADVQALTEGRNDFIHAIYGADPGHAGIALFSGVKHPVKWSSFGDFKRIAMRVRNQKKKPVAEMRTVRAIAVRVSLRTHIIETRVRRRLAQKP